MVVLWFKFLVYIAEQGIFLVNKLQTMKIVSSNIIRRSNTIAMPVYLGVDMVETVRLIYVDSMIEKSL